MKKIEKILKDPTDAFFDLADRRCYFVPVDRRKKESLDTQEVFIRDIVLKVDELVEAVNQLQEEKNAK